MSRKLIPEKLYKRIVRLVSICCVDALVVCGNEFLLAKRKKDPCKNLWWFPGGRILFQESPIAGIKRKLKEELGLKEIKKIELLDVGENKYYKKGYFGLSSHTINIVFLAEIGKREAGRIRLDSQHSDYAWLKRIPKRVHPYIKKSLKLAGFHE